MMRFGHFVGFAAVALAVLAGGNPASAQGGTFVPTGSLVDGGRAFHVAARLGDGRVLVATGTVADHSGVRNSAEIWDPATGTWSPTGDMADGRTYATASVLADGRVFIVGGSNGGGVHNSTEIYDPATGTFSAGSPMIVQRFVHTATTLADGRILVTGGDNSTDGPVAWSSAEIYDPASHAWTLTGSMTVARQAHKAVLLPGGKVLVVGGDQGATNGYTPMTSCEIFDPATGTFSATASMATPRSQPGAVLLADGRVLVAGGTRYGSDFAHDAEIFDPATSVWTSAGTIGSGGPHVTLTVLPDGRALSAGGFDTPGTLEASRHADMFDPATGTFSALPDMGHARAQATATLLVDGSVLIVGGYDLTGFPYDTDTAERFVPEPSNHAPVANAGGNRSVECTGPAGASVLLDGSGSSDADGDALSYTWTGPFGSVTGVSAVVSLPMGANTISLTVTDSHGSSATDTVVILVQDTTKPVISSLSANPSTLWPPNHQMVAVTLTAVASDACDPSPVCTILSVTSNEAVNGTGDGDSSPDWQVTGALTLNLRSERAGGGSGRIYTIVVVCQDASGNFATRSVTVAVPKSKGK